MYQLLAYINYWLRSVNEHSLQSPFLFDFYETVVKGGMNEANPNFEALRNELLKNHSVVNIQELGAGSRLTKSNQRTVRHIARHSSTPLKFSCLLYRLIQKFKPKNIIELGTSLGINSLYMASADKEANIFTFEGDVTIADYAQRHFDLLKAENIKLIKGNIDNTLPDFLDNKMEVDLVYMDANHRYEPTISYFDMIRPQLNSTAIVIMDDIYWSKEMNQAWNEIKSRPEISISIDLFEAGILFLYPQVEQPTTGNWVIQY